MNRDEAQAALAAVNQAQGKLADRIEVPVWRHLAFGGMFALINVAISLPPAGFGPIFLLWGILFALLLRYDRRRYGVFINGYRRGRTLPVTLCLLALQVGLVVLARPARHLPFPSALGLACAAAAFVVAVIGSMIFQRVLMAELRSKSE